MNHRPTADAFADYAYHYAKRHTDWDDPAALIPLHWNGTCITAHACVFLAVPTPTYQPAITWYMREYLNDNAEDDPLCGILLFTEAYELGPLHEMKESGMAHLVDDQANRYMRQHPDTVEKAYTFVAALDDRVWTAVEERRNPGTVVMSCAASERSNVYSNLLGVELRQVIESIRQDLAIRGQ